MKSHKTGFNLFVVLLLTAIVFLTGCFHGVKIPPEAVAYKTGPIAYEDNIGVIVRNEDGTFSVVVFANDGYSPTTTETQRFFQSVMRDHVIDDREAKAINKLIAGAAGDIITSQIGFTQGCVEKNPLFQSQKIGPMILFKSVGVGLAIYGAKQSTRYESMVNYDSRYINVLAASQWYLTGKNAYTIATGC